MSAQTLSSEQYTYGRNLYNQLDALNTDVGNMTKLKLTGSDKEGAITYVRYGAKGKDLYTIHEFRYTENGITAIWKRSDAKWIYSDEEEVEELIGIVNGASEVADNTGNTVNNTPSIPSTSEEPSSEESNSEEPTSEESTTEAPISEEPTTEEPTTEEITTTEEATTTEEETPIVENVNVAGGELVIKVNGEDLATGKMIKSEDFWPDADTLAETQTNVILKRGDVFMYNGILYIALTDQNLWYEHAKAGAVDPSVSNYSAYPLDYLNPLTKADFPIHWGSTPVIEENQAGKIYYDEENKILFAAYSSSWYYIPTKDNYQASCWFILKDLNEENQE